MKAWVTAACALAMAGPAIGATITTGVSNPGTDNVLFNDAGLVTSGHFYVEGATSNGTKVLFTSNEDLKINTNNNGGQAQIVANDGSFQYMIMAFEDPQTKITKLVFNIDATNDGTVQFFADSSFSGTTFVPGTAIPDASNSAVTSFNLSGHGENFFTMVDPAGIGNLGFQISGDVGNVAVEASDLQQVRIAGTTVPVPLPTSVMGGALLLPLLALQRRRRA